MVSVGGGRGQYSVVSGDVPLSLLNRMTSVTECQADGMDNDNAEFVAVTWNACGMDKDGISTLVDTLNIECLGWDAVMLQEGPIPENSSMEVCEIEGGHLLFIGSLFACHRSVCILLHRRWVHSECKFYQSTGRIVFLDGVFGNTKLRIVSAHLPHSGYPIPSLLQHWRLWRK